MEQPPTFAMVCCCLSSNLSHEFQLALPLVLLEIIISLRDVETKAQTLVKLPTVVVQVRFYLRSLFTFSF
jgi:hypothetical protein